MKRTLITLLQSFACLIVTQAQTQQGYVKTLGRPNQKGVALSGVSVRVQGAHNTVLSKNDGTFSMLIQRESYSLQQVHKSGYELNEAGIIGRKYAYSATVPLTIVMTSKQQLLADKQRIENNAYQVAERNYKARMEQLESAKARNNITIDQYRQQIQDLQDKFEKYQSMIDGLADHYARTDYDDLDEKEREINISIENGDLEHADSMLQQLDVHKRIAAIEKQLKTGQGLMDKANEDWAALLRQQEKDAEHLYQLYTISLARFDNQQAKYYIETRAALDTTNVKWQQDAGDFACEYLSDYDLGISHYQAALIQEQQQKGESHPSTTKSCVALSFIYELKGQNEIAYAYFSQAYQILREVEYDYPEETAGAFLALGRLSMAVGKYSNLEEIFKHALDLTKQKFGTESDEVASCLTYLGGLASHQSDFGKAISFYQEALTIREKILGKEHPHTLKSYNHLATLYIWTNNFPKALNYAQAALKGLCKVYGQTSVDVATCHATLSSIYFNKYDYQSSITEELEALRIFIEIFGEAHPKVADAYNTLGNIYLQIKDYEQSISSYQKATNILISLYGLNNPSVSHSIHGAANVSSEIGEYETAKDLYEQAYEILKSSVGENHAFTAALYNDIALMYSKQGDKSTAIAYYEKAINIKRLLFGERNSQLAITYGNIAVLYGELKDLNKAMSYWQKSLDIQREVFGENSDNVGNIYTRIGQMYIENSLFKIALDYYKKALAIFKIIHEANHSSIKVTKESIDLLEQIIQ